MKIESIDWDGTDAGGLAQRLRGATEPKPEIVASVAETIAAVRTGGVGALLEAIERFDGIRPDPILIDPDGCAAALEKIAPALSAALERAATNIRIVAASQVRDDVQEVELPEGQRVTMGEIPVAAAGIYVPGGRAPYPSTALMGVIAAREAGVPRVVIASPPGPNGRPDTVILAAAEIAGADGVYAMGGAQAIAALAYGVEGIDPVDVIAGPGGLYVQEAKVQVSRRVRIDGYAGPSELAVVADESVSASWVALDLCAQAEHGADGLQVLIALSPKVRDRTVAEIERIATEPTVTDAPLAAVVAPTIEAAIGLVNALAPEHLELACEGAADIAAGVHSAGCVFVGAHGATAFGDYAAGSNHVLPTGGAGRFMGPLAPATFRRRSSVVQIGPEAARKLAPAVAEIALAEGFKVHADSATARASDPPEKA